MELIEYLRRNRSFEGVADHVLEAFAALMTRHAVHGGESVFAEGVPADSVLLLLKGYLRVLRRADGGAEQLYNEVAPGALLGLVQMVLGQNRTADVVALRDSEFALLTRAQLHQLLKQFPEEVNAFCCRAIGTRQRGVMDEHESRGGTSFLVLPLSGEIDPTPFGLKLAEALSCKADVSLEQGGGVTRHVRCQATARGAALPEQGFRILLGNLTASEWSARALRQADQIVFLADARSGIQDARVAEFLAQAAVGRWMRKHLVILNHGVQSALPEGVDRWKSAFEFERLYFIDQDNEREVARLSRFLTNSAVGLVLGGGGARGFAHLGVLQALEELGMPVDLVGGNSMGALIGAQYALGQTPKAILETTRDFALGGEYPTLPFVSLLSGRRMARDLRTLFGEQRIEAMKNTFFAVSCSLSQANIHVHDEGALWAAVLASNSPAGLLPPVVENGELLVDAGILDNVPVLAMRTRLGVPTEKRKGNGIILAVDVDVREALGSDQKAGVLSPWGIFRRKKSPNILNLLSVAGHVGGMAQRMRTRALADIYLEPPVSSYSMLAYRKAEEICHAGYEYALKALTQWEMGRDSRVH